MVKKGGIPWNRGKKMTDTTKQKISLAHLGVNNHFFGKKHSLSAKRKMSKTRKIKIKSGEIVIIPPMLGKKLSQQHKEKISVSFKGSKNPFFGKKHTREAIEKNRLSHLNKIPWNKGVPNYKNRGAQNNNWKGGINDINLKIRTSLEYKNWRSSVFKRDNYTCQNCFKKNIKLNAHHIKYFSLFPELRFVVSNGISLCLKCHIDTHKKNEKN
jgi:5-methylcytosine-specific restriction endonuclease McrA